MNPGSTGFAATDLHQNLPDTIPEFIGTCSQHDRKGNHLRELTFLEEEYHQAWARDLKDLLQEMRTAADQARTQGHHRLPAAQHAPLLARYRRLLAAGL